MLESLRLWPTAPFVLRESTKETTWENGVMPAGMGIFIFAPFFHRDETRLPYAHRFAPEIWLDNVTAEAQWPLIPFSGGPGICPGRNLVLLTTSAMLAEILPAHEFRLTSPSRLDPAKPLPGTLDLYSLHFQLAR